MNRDTKTTQGAVAAGLGALLLILTPLFSTFLNGCSSKANPASPAATPTPLPSVSTLCTFTTGEPSYLAVDNQGNVYAATTGSTILKCTSAGVTSTYATGFSQTEGVAVDSSINLYVADAGAKTVSKITSGGTVSTLGGSFSFNTPWALAINSAATTLFISDVGANTIDTLVLGSNTASTIFNSIDSIEGLAVDANGDLYVSASAYNILSYIPSSFSYVGTYAGTGTGAFANGSLTSAEFYEPLQIAMDSHGNIYVADYKNNAIRVVSTSASTVGTLVGPAADSPTVTQTLSDPPFGVAVDGSGNVYFSAGYSIYKYKP